MPLAPDNPELAVTRHSADSMRALVDELAPLAPRSLTVLLDVSNKCNIRCRMCYFSYDSVFYRKAQHLDPRKFAHIAEQLFPLAHTVYLSAGSEPLTSPCFIELLRIAAPYRVPDLKFLTNGLLLTPEISRALIECGVKQIHVSTEGATKTTYEWVRRGADFDRLLRNLRELDRLKRELGSETPWVQLNAMVMRRNLAELPQLVDLAQSVGATRIACRHLMPYDGLGIDEESPHLDKAGTNHALRELMRRAIESRSVAIVNLPDPFTLDDVAAQATGERATAAHAASNAANDTTANKSTNAAPNASMHAAPSAATHASTEAATNASTSAASMTSATPAPTALTPQAAPLAASVQPAGLAPIDSSAPPDSHASPDPRAPRSSPTTPSPHRTRIQPAAPAPPTSAPHGAHAPHASPAPHARHVDAAPPLVGHLAHANRRPFGQLDQPSEPYRRATRAVEFSGWALAHDGIAAVELWREPLPDETGEIDAELGLVALGSARFLAGMRPDVAAQHPDVDTRYRNAWSFVLQADAWPSAHGSVLRVHVIARDTRGQRTELGQRTLVRDGADEQPYLYCKRAFDCVYIDAAGDVYPYPDCQSLDPFARFDGASDFRAIWLSEPFRELRRRILEQDPPRMCVVCPDRINRNVDDRAFFEQRGVSQAYNRPFGFVEYAGPHGPERLLWCGWALAPQHDVRVRVVRELRDAASDATQWVTLGEATRSDTARPDIAREYPRIRAALRSSWSFEFATSELGPGRHRVAVRAISSDGTSTEIGAHAIELADDGTCAITALARDAAASTHAHAPERFV